MSHSKSKEHLDSCPECMFASKVMTALVDLAIAEGEAGNPVSTEELTRVTTQAVASVTCAIAGLSVEESADEFVRILMDSPIFAASVRKAAAMPMPKPEPEETWN